MERPLNDAIDWIKQQQQTLDEALAAAGRSYFENLLARPNALYDLSKANQESYCLSEGRDLCYDRPAIGLVYGLWYHARRVNTSLGLVLPALFEAEGEKVQLYDLGAGTGAFLWAITLGCQALHKQGAKPPHIRVINIDTSPFMLHYLQHLWQALAARYDVCEEIEVECQLNTWSRHQPPLPHTWLCASYLFDHEDKKEDLTRDFGKLVKRLQPERIFLSTSNQAKKRAFMNSIAGRLEIQQDEAQPYIQRPAINEYIFHGLLPAVNALRGEIQQNHRIPTMRPVALWKVRSFTGYAFSRRQASLPLSGDQHVPNHIELFPPHIENRLQIDLSKNKDQEKAATPDGYPTVIFGPAGCGKSVVITERVKNLVVASNYDPDLRILVTTFNKELQKEVLRPWLEELLDKDRCRSVNPTGTEGEPCRDFYFDGSSLPNIRLMHFDVLPTRLAKVHRWKLHEKHGSNTLYEDRICLDEVEELCAQAVKRVSAELEKEGENLSRFEHVLDPEYLWDEFHRIYYGQWQLTKERYMVCNRPGRSRLDREKMPRQVLWRCIEAVNDLCWEGHRHTFTHRRIGFLQYLGGGGDRYVQFAGRPLYIKTLEHDYPSKFTHVFVDEVQDCTKADFGIFYRLLEDPNELVVGGDLAQAVHLGRSAFSNIPRLDLNKQKRRKFHELHGSYRLPFRISEALIPLSERIQDKRKGAKDRVEAKLQNPYRGSPPGARPIFIWAQTTHAMAQKVKAVRQAYSESLGSVGFKLGRCSILEKDVPLRKALSNINVDAETNTILRLKGTEKTCLLWSTRRSTESKEEAEEFAYTILTRGSRLLIVALFPDTCEEFKPIINTFKHDRIILWDQETEQRFSSCCRDAPFTGEYEEHDDPVWEDRS